MWYKLPWQDRLVKVPVGRYSPRSHKDRFIGHLAQPDISYSHMSIWVDWISHPVRQKYKFYQEASVATNYQEMTRMLGDLPWSGRQGCYVVFHVKLSLCCVRAPIYIFISIGCCVIIQVVIYWMISDHPSRFQPLRSRGRIIWKSKVESFGYGISLGLFPPLIMVGNCAYHVGKSVHTLQSVLNLFKQPHPWNGQSLG